jgi:hypothetical protein
MPVHFSELEVSTSSLQQRLSAVTDMKLAAIAVTANLKSQLSELEGLRERVRYALEIAAPETVECTALRRFPVLQRAHWS